MRLISASIFLLAVFVSYRFQEKMLKLRYPPWVVFPVCAAAQVMASYVNVECGLYLVFPQEIFYLLVDTCLLLVLFCQDFGKKFMTLILLSGSGYIANFMVLPFVDYLTGRFAGPDGIDGMFLICDMLTLALRAAMLEWILRKNNALRGDLPAAGVLYLIFLSAFISQAVIFYGENRIAMNALPFAAQAAGFAAVGALLLLLSIYYLDKRVTFALMEQQYRMVDSHIRALRESGRQRAGLAHDFKNHLLCIKNLLNAGLTQEAGDYLASLTDSALLPGAGISTGNPYADAVLNEKMHTADRERIRMEADMGFPGEDALPPADFCIILSNALDNALEACARIADPGLRWVRAVSYTRGSCLFIEIHNSTCKEARRPHGWLRTTKADPSLHGIGLGNIRAAVERCGGRLTLSADDGEFHFCAMLPLSGK